MLRNIYLFYVCLYLLYISNIIYSLYLIYFILIIARHIQMLVSEIIISAASSIFVPESIEHF